MDQKTALDLTKTELTEADSKQEAGVEATSAVQLEMQTEPKAESAPQPRPVPQPSPMPQPRPAPQPSPMPQPGPAPQPSPMPQPGSIPQAAPAPQASKDKSMTVKVLTGVGALLAVVIVIILLVTILRLVFSSIISVIVVAVGAYIVYHRWGAIYITRRKYEKDSKVLQLPEGMNSETLFQSLSGKFNYPYFNGVRYGEQGECIIEGRYSAYTVMFDENSQATLSCEIQPDDKKARTIMMEAIAIRHYINKFFNPALPFDAAKYYNSLKSAEKQRKVVAVVLSVATVTVIGLFIFEHAFPGGVQKITTPGIEVRGAYLTQYSESITVEEAFENFFDNAKWSTYKDKGDTYVVFTGVCLIYEERSDIKITFKVMSEQFRIDSLEINGLSQGDLMVYTLLSAVYEDY